MTSSKTQFRDARRIWLKKAGALTSSSALPLWAQRTFAQSAVALNTLPRVALIIGNTKYAEAPLKNPANDAKAIAGELQKVGFNVNLVLDAGRAQLAGAITAFGSSLAKTKGVGLFYYAGHGAQLAWRNYLIPVDAVIEKLDDMRDKTVELNTLLQGLIAAKNPMNVIILDACRDNPFGTKVPTEAKGLSQFDAPPGSLLAYATSPGNTASDGDGANGLYTENLLREIRMPDAKIEDVFKRVRLAVRRRSEGQQIPWESTSLEDDFYFVPPKELKKLSADEIEKQFELELGIWEKIKSSKESEPLETYLRQFPSGKFSELAQFRLDRLLAEKEKSRLNSKLLAKQAAEERQRLALAAEVQRQAEEKRLAEEKRIAEERRLAEQKRVAEEKRLAEERRLTEQKRLLEEQNIAKLSAERRRVEEARLAAEFKAGETRRLAEEKRLVDERRAAEEKRIAEEKRLSDERRRSEEERLAKLEESRRAAPIPVSTPIGSIAPNPFSKGTAKTDFGYKIGDKYSYREIDLLTKLETGKRTLTVTAIGDDEVTYNDGRLVTDFLGNIVKNPRGQTFVGRQIFVGEYSIGRKWTTIYRGLRYDLKPDEFVQNFQVVSRENISLPAGTFFAFKIEGDGYLRGAGSQSRITYWVAPEQVRTFLVFELVQRSRGGQWIDSNRSELIAYQQTT